MAFRFNPFTGELDNVGLINKVNYIDYNTSYTPDSTPNGRSYWNDTDRTLNISPGEDGPLIFVGQEVWSIVFNGSDETMLKGKVVHPFAAVSGYPVVQLADAKTHEKLLSAVLLTAEEIPAQSFGIASFVGKVRGLDTSGLSPGPVYISADTPGELTSTPPGLPHYNYQIGGVFKVDETDGVVQTGTFDSYLNTTNNYWNGSFRETFDFRVRSDGATITGSLEPANGHDDMTMIFSDGFTLLDTNPPATIELTPGTDSNPQTNYIYIPKTTKVLTLSTSDWPVAEHIRVAQVYLQTAATTKTEGGLRNQNWNDHIASTNTSQGHNSHIGARIRALVAEWDTGAETSLSGTTSDVYISSTSGKVFQLHLQVFPAQDMTQYTIDAVDINNDTFTISGDGDLSSTFPDEKVIGVHDSTGNDGRWTIASTLWSDPDFIITVEEDVTDATADGTIGDHIHVVNDSVSAYRESTNLNDLTVDSEGTTLNNRWFSIVIWGTANKSGEPSHLMCNLPSGSYTSEANAVSDALGYSNYIIPKVFKGVGFLMARFTIRKSGASFTYNSGVGYQDLRGFIPNSTAGSGAGSSGITTFLGLTDTSSSYTSQGNKLTGVNVGETALEFISDIKVATINEYTADAGVTIEGITLKDSIIGSNLTQIVAGSVASAGGDNGIAILGTIPSGTKGIAIGLGSELTVDGTSGVASYGIAVGRNASSTYLSIACGYNATCSEDASMTFGYNSSVASLHACNFGEAATIDALSDYAFGGGYNSTITNSESALVLGHGGEADGALRGIALGFSNLVNASNAIILGNDITNSLANSITFGGTSNESILNNGRIFLKGFAAAITDVASQGQLYYKTDKKLYFQDEDGTSYDLTAAGGGGGNVSNTGTPVNNQIAIWTDATTIEGNASLTYNGTILNPAGSGTNSTLIGCGNSTASQEGSVVIGCNHGNRSGVRSLRIGFQSGAPAMGQESVGLGYATKSGGLGSVAIGRQSDAGSASYALALGSLTDALAADACAIGRSSVASGLEAYAFGVSTNATQIRSTAFGANCDSTHAYAHVFGYLSASRITNSIVLGGTNNTAVDIIGSIFQKEQAGSLSDATNYGQTWISTSDGLPRFTTSAGVEYTFDMTAV